MNQTLYRWGSRSKGDRRNWDIVFTYAFLSRVTVLGACTMGLIHSGGFPLSGAFSRNLAVLSIYNSLYGWRSLCYASGVPISEPHAPETDFQLSCSNENLDQLFHPGR